jgi:N-acyl-D-amino-acid deacylase
VIGNCGSSPAPLLGASLEEAQAWAKQMGYEIDWFDMAGYIDKLNENGIALNVVALVGHNTVRGSVLGYDDVQPTSEQQAEMECLVVEAMDQGARGMSSGLYYPPGYYAVPQEVIGMAKVVAEHGGVYATHIRSESDGLFPAVEEAIEIGRKSGARVLISHLKMEGYRNFEGVDRLMQMIDDANEEGVTVLCDQYPYMASSTWLAAILPYWAQAGGGKAVAGRLKDPETRALLKKDWEENRIDWENRGGMKTWEDVLVAEAEGRPEAVGKRISEVATMEGKDPIDTCFDLIIENEGGPGCVFFDMLEENVRVIMQHPRVVLSSDGASLSPEGLLGQGKPHPRSYGTFPRALGKYVREEKVLSWEKAIQRMTSTTAEYFGLQDRGVIRSGAWADLVLFDPEVVIDKATFTDPHQFPVGIPYVIVNGEFVIKDGEHTGKLPGRVI